MSDFVQYPDPRLKASATPAAGVDAVLRGIGERLLAAALSSGAYGLAAVHLGDVAPVVVISDEQAPQQRRLLFNPHILAVADTAELGEEGSVSLPGIRVEIARPVWAEIAFMDEAGTPMQIHLDGFAARVALHEIEQMQGLFFLDRVSRLKRDRALKKARKAAG